MRINFKIQRTGFVNFRFYEIIFILILRFKFLIISYFIINVISKIQKESNFKISRIKFVDFPFYEITSIY